MNTRRSISLVLVLTLTMATSACSTTTTVDLQSDPSDSAVRTQFESGQEIKVAGYTRVSDGHRDWKGLVQLAPPDSVQFTPSSRSYRDDFKLSRSDLASIDYRGFDARVAAVCYAPHGGDTAAGPTATGTHEISVVTSSPRRSNSHSNQKAVTIGIFVAVVGAVAIGYVVAGQ